MWLRSATANIHVQFDTLPAGASTYFMYYGNPSAANGFPRPTSPPPPRAWAPKPSPPKKIRRASGVLEV